MSGHRSLAFRLYNALRDPTGNLLVSPCSVWAALALLQPGAGGVTLDQLTALLGIADPGPVVELVRTLQERSAPLSSTARTPGGEADAATDAVNERLQILLASKLWVQTGYQLEPGYVQRLTDVLASAPASMDFQASPDEACKRINEWAAQATGGHIEHILPGVPAATRAILASAIYFKAEWASPFNPDRTRNGLFHGPDGRALQVPMMRQTEYFAYAADEDVQLVELPYVGRELVMDIVLPRRGHLEAAEASLSLPYFFTLLGELDSGTYVDLALPRFHVAGSVELAATLQRLGLVDAFGSSADFTAMSPEPGFHIDDIRHAAFLDAGERGTEAAAAPITQTLGMKLSSHKPVEVHVDRPFIFFIRDVPDNAILFIGRCAVPTARAA